jgi:hypothetical protein
LSPVLGDTTAQRFASSYSAVTVESGDYAFIYHPLAATTVQKTIDLTGLVPVWAWRTGGRLRAQAGCASTPSAKSAFGNRARSPLVTVPGDIAIK